MDCLRPISVHRRDLDLPHIRVTMEGEEVRYGGESVLVPCGRCEACQANQRQQWAMRLYYEWLHADTAAFCTLTYDSEHLYINRNGVPSVNKRDFQLFMKRVRKKYGSGLRFFCISEYGDDPRYTHRPHYHFLLFNFPQKDFLVLAKELVDLWKNCDYVGLHKVCEPVNGERIGYVSGYVTTRKAAPRGADPNFMLCSRRPAIGAFFLTDAAAQYYNRNCSVSVKTPIGTYPLHRYFREKIQDDDYKERSIEVVEKIKRKRNLKRYGFSDFRKDWTDEEIVSHGLTRAEYRKIIEDDEKRLQAWVEAFRKKQKHKHIKL